VDSLSDPPAADVIEVSIFGPGKGESVVVHLGNDEWIVVDSCMNQRETNRLRTVAPLSYLERLGIVVADAVKLVVATHAHDDHFAGIAEVFRNCRSANFVCSDAMSKEEFWALCDADERMGSDLRKRAYSEYRAIRREIINRSGEQPGFRPLRFAIESRPLLTITDGHSASVTALSPSDEAVTRSRTALASAFPRPGGIRKEIKADPNELSVALWIRAADKAVLLGADLPKGPKGCGWIAVLAAFQSDVKASVFKVSHHGSITGHHDDIWTELLTPTPVALLTPYRGGRNPLPDPSDRQRILSFTSEAFTTARSDIPAPSRSARKEAAALGPLARNAREIWGRVGHVRARSRIGENNWHIDFSAPACELNYS
jgi:hypothetical protein